MNIIIYTTGPQCTRCQALKTALTKAGLPYEERPLDSAIMAECACCTGISTREAPLVQIGAIWIFADDLFGRDNNLLPGWRRNF